MSLVRVRILSDDHLFSDGLAGIVAAEAAFTIARTDEDSGHRGRTAHQHVLLLDSRIERAFSLCRDISVDGKTMIVLLALKDDDARSEERRVGKECRL